MHNPYEEDVAGTDWSRLSVGQMWAALGDFDHEPASAQSAGWDRAFELLDYHRARLEEYRDLVAARWRGETAEAFLAEFGGLIDAVRVLRDVALANSPVLPHLSASMVEARAALAPVHERWVANQAVLAGSRSAPAGGVPQPAPSPGAVAVSPGAQDRLHAQAVDIMMTLTDRVIEGYQAIKVPPDYKPKTGIGNLSKDHGEPAGSGPARLGGGAPPPLRSSSTPGITGVPTAVPSPGGGSVLSGVSSATPTTSGSPTQAGSIGGGVPVVGRVIGMVPPPPFGGGLPAARANPGRRPPLRPGGVINGPGLGIDPAVPVRSVGPRANPVGGVIGPTTGHESEAMMAPMAGAGGRPGDQRRRGRNPEYDSNEHWPVPKGVPPVLGLPGPEPEHDAGIPLVGQPRQRRDR